MPTPRIIPGLHIARRVCGALMLAIIIFQLGRLFSLVHPALLYTYIAWAIFGIVGIGNWILVEIQRRYSPPDFED